MVSDTIQADHEKAELVSEEKKDFRKWDPLVNVIANLLPYSRLLADGACCSSWPSVLRLCS